MTYTFTIPGIAQPAGSKRAFVLKKAGQYTGRAVVADANPKSKSWQAEVKHAALNAGVTPLDGPISLALTFFMPRPKGHFGTGKNAATLKPDAPDYPIGRPDVLKLARGIEDALTGIAWRDDAQIVTETLEKLYCDHGEMPLVAVAIHPK